MIRTLACTFALACPSMAQSTWYVDANGSAPGTGTLADPYTSLQFALQQPGTVTGDTLLVASGNYPGTVDLLGKDVLIDGSGADPRPVLDGMGLGSVVIAIQGESAACELRGLTITGGSGSVVGQDSVGGGAWIQASPTFRDVHFLANAADYGAGAAVLAGDPHFEDCSFDGNLAADAGGALHVGPQAAGTSLLNCQLTSNRAGSFNFPGRGGAIHAMGPLTAIGCELLNNGKQYSTDYGGGSQGGVFQQCRFQGNEATVGGGLEDGEAVDCVFEDNEACGDGFGIGGAANNCLLQNCTLQFNFACGAGGGASSSDLEDCQVLYNRTSTGGPGGDSSGGGLSGGTATRTRIHGNVAHTNGPPSSGGGAFGTTLIRCEVTSNAAWTGAGLFSGSSQQSTLVGNHALDTTGGSAVLNGSHTGAVVWGNFAPLQTDGASFTYSNVEGLSGGLGNISVDPMLLGPAGSDVRLLAGSPCIDAGNPAAPRDPDGSPADMGVYPFDPAAALVAASYCRPDSGLLSNPCPTLVQTQGDSSIGSAGDLVLRVDGLDPAQFGLLFHGTQPSSGWIQMFSFPMRTICVGGSLVRMTPMSTGTDQGPCTGELTQPLSDAYLTSQGLVPGDRLYAQFWFRRSGQASFGFSNAVEIPVLP